MRKKRQLADGRGEERVGRRAESNDRKKAWSSINHSILTVTHCSGHSPESFKKKRTKNCFLKGGYPEISLSGMYE
jgi:hypothetical protein